MCRVNQVGSNTLARAPFLIIFLFSDLKFRRAAPLARYQRPSLLTL